MIRNIELVDFLAHSNTKLEFENDATVFVGDNGAGKSSIIDAITFSLFGEHTRKNNKGLIRRGANQGFAKIEFSANGKNYQAVRRIDYKGALTAQFVEDILNSTLSQCCTFYFASTEGIFYQTGQTYWSKDSAEGSSDFSTSYAMVPRGESGTKYMAPVFDAWLLASLQGTAILPKSLTHEQLTQQMSGLVRDKETGSMRLPHAATGPGSQLVVMASNHGKHSYSNTRDGLLLTQGAQPTLRDFM